MTRTLRAECDAARLAGLTAPRPTRLSPAGVGHLSVTAPREAVETSFMYFASSPAL